MPPAITPLPRQARPGRGRVTLQEVAMAAGVTAITVSRFLAAGALDRLQIMLNFDMIGRLRDDKLIVYGVATATELKPLVDSLNAAVGHFTLNAVGDGYGPSDHASFYGAGVPVLHFFTDVHEDYHRATDVASKINITGEARVIVRSTSRWTMVPMFSGRFAVWVVMAGTSTQLRGGGGRRRAGCASGLRYDQYATLCRGLE